MFRKKKEQWTLGTLLTVRNIGWFRIGDIRSFIMAKDNLNVYHLIVTYKDNTTQDIKLGSNMTDDDAYSLINGINHIMET